MSCERCYEYPALRDCLGCGYPPKADDDVEQRMYSYTPTGRSPMESVRSGQPAFRYGVDPIIVDWPWCPVWFARYSTASIGGQDAAVYIRRAFEFHERGELPGLIEPPWTSALIDLIDWWRQIGVALDARAKEGEIEKIRTKIEMERLRREHARKL